jgi:hypothetical protein
MQAEIPVFDEDSTLISVRRRSQGYLAYLFWVGVVLCLLWAANAIASLLKHWVVLYGVRNAAGLRAPVAGPDYFIFGGVGVLALLSIMVLAVAYSSYRAAWNRRLRVLWGASPKSSHARIWQLHEQADEAELRRRILYLQTLASCSQRPEPALELSLRAALSDGSRESYKNAAAEMLKSIEQDIVKRAVTAGLVIGLNTVR